MTPDPAETGEQTDPTDAAYTAAEEEEQRVVDKGWADHEKEKEKRDDGKAS